MKPVILNQNEFIKYMEQKFRWAPFFKLTNLCDYCCAHCCEKSGPNAEPKFIPIADIKYILDMFIKSQKSVKIAIVTGGEPMTAYDKVSPHYIPTLMSAAIKRGYMIELKTNGAWTLGKNAGQIFSDLNSIYAKYPKSIIAYHLSLDKFHPKSDITTANIIKWFAENQNISYMNIVHIFYDDYHRLTDMLVDMAGRDNILVDIHAQIPEKLKAMPLWKIRDHEKYIYPELYSGIDNVGRAKDNNIGNRYTGLTQIINGNENIKPIQFDANGFATLFACNDFGIRTPYRDNKGRIKNLTQIKSELFNTAYSQYMTEMQFMR